MSSVKPDFILVHAALIMIMVAVVGIIVFTYSGTLRHQSIANRITSADKGIEKKVVEALPKSAYDSDRRKISTGDCVICLMEYADGDKIRVLPECGHGFHVGCIEKWLGLQSSCPSCRRKLIG
ncbi:hypothetical protein L1987_68443 [Smallanthus sonchifolius]|uniref:Uncharacterized protein n=1 Tax=Smallanthus sonchifolius TaxID=185202 RepID=A0ACB9B3K4_9ASTR|nr:hypothetical protein L1987_68443 [Smallanthus sonchifolius]